MKIVCDSCATKYSIADEKVRGKVFKIRCKKCSHIIVVRGGETGGPETAAAPATDGGWHLVIDGEQVGPIGDADVRTKIERGEVKGDTYTWKEGFADWVKLSAVPEFAALVAEDVAGVASGGGEMFPSGAVSVATANGTDRARRASGAGRSLFGGGGASDVFAASASPAISEGGGLFGSAAAAPASEESRWPSSGAAAAGHDGGRVESLTGQRHENSVLFSLSNLQSLAMPAAKPASTASASSSLTEGSGLIDIRQMAASTLGASSGGGGLSFGGGSSGSVDDLPAFGAFSPAAPVLLPLSSSSGPPKWVYVALGPRSGGRGRHRAHGLQGSDHQIARAGRAGAAGAGATGAGETGPAGTAAGAKRQAVDHRRGELASARGELRSEGAKEPSTSITTAARARKRKRQRRGAGATRRRAPPPSQPASLPRRSPPRDRSTI